MTQRQEGSFKAGESELETKLHSIESKNPAHAKQIHSDRVLVVDQPGLKSEEADALITQAKNLPLLIKVADCQGVIIYDPQNEAIANIHSGWKGSAQNIVGKTLQKMKVEFKSDPAQLLVAVSPSLGPCCGEFSDPKNELPPFCYPFILDNNHVDFWQLTQMQCEDEGVKPSNIEIAGICTKCSLDYFSHRQGDVERMGVFIEMIE